MNVEIAPKETEVRLTWDEARMYSFSLNIDGKTGWRLPDKDELNEIYQAKNDFEKWYYWSSTARIVNRAWSHCFAGGSRGYHSKNFRNVYVRAVRDFS
jgi:hypothetical protein